ncbi:MAG: hypothetical protein KAS99_01685, partial [Candidatus Omnitrophica bacterium]|nr:hypothetical protein [Candidatus Omnitrophota bacterium]
YTLYFTLSEAKLEPNRPMINVTEASHKRYRFSQRRKIHRNKRRYPDKTYFLVNWSLENS